MKNLILFFVVVLGFVACNDNNASGTGSSVDSISNARDPAVSSDHTMVQPDTTIVDSGNREIGDTNMRKDNPPGTSSGQSGSATGSNNSGSVKDDTKGNK